MIDTTVVDGLFFQSLGGGIESRAKAEFIKYARIIAPYFHGQWPTWRLTWEYMTEYTRHYKWNLEREMSQFDPASARALAQIPVTSVVEPFMAAIVRSLSDELPGYEPELGFDLDAFIDLTVRANVHVDLEIFPRDPNIPRDSFVSILHFEKPIITTEAYRREHGDNAALEMIYPLIALPVMREGGNQEEAQNRFNYHRGIWPIRGDDLIHHFMSVVALTPENGEVLEPHMFFDGDDARKADGKLRFTRV